MPKLSLALGVVEGGSGQAVPFEGQLPRGGPMSGQRPGREGGQMRGGGGKPARGPMGPGLARTRGPGRVRPTPRPQGKRPGG